MYGKYKLESLTVSLFPIPMDPYIEPVYTGLPIWSNWSKVSDHQISFIEWYQMLHIAFGVSGMFGCCASHTFRAG